VVEVFETTAARKDSLKGYRIAWESERMRHFSAKFEPL